ncbi:glycosyl transferase group 1 [Thalassoporum mexicanum PCC 7367]|uniref:glycosyltransferase WbuB n=1 Tax=Thalassoporum mexicanum TaxID=3457544 RepID=UPI00029F92B6|nr:glycosyltransferase WbuB [Pseudanabaena sp. PCC 7367]AFY69437.1 glycosyl transferase group 1 [Pseudanabaena sp. PCC 7367]
MRILIYGINYAPEITGIGKYTSEMCEWLRQQGHEIRVVTAPPYYPKWEVAEGYRGWQYKQETIADIKLYRCPLWVPSQLTGAKRLLHLFSFAITSLPVILWQGLWWRPDLVWLVAPTLFAVPGAWLAAAIGGAKSWLHIQDFEVDAAFDLGILSGKFRRSLVCGLERWLLRRFDRVSSITTKMVQRLRHKRLDQRKLLLFPNWVDTSQIYPLRYPRHPNPLRKQLGIPANKTVVLYSGNMGRKQGLEIAIEAAHQLQQEALASSSSLRSIQAEPQQTPSAQGKFEPRSVQLETPIELHSNSTADVQVAGEIMFILCGDGMMKGHLQHRAEQLGLNNVKFLPLQPIEQLNNLLNLADIHILPQKADVSDQVMPSKLAGILACGGAVVATAHPNTELANVVTAAGGQVCPPENVNCFTKGIKYLATNRQARTEIKRCARQYAINHLDRRKILSDFERELQKLCAMLGTEMPGQSSDQRQDTKNKLTSAQPPRNYY